VDTYPLTIYSAAAVQELHRENRTLKRQLAEQERRLQRLEALIENR
jgi:cell shape-determining protein MreC